MSDIENSDLYDGASSDAPLIDSLGSAVKRLIDRGKSRGFITMEELNKEVVKAAIYLQLKDMEKEAR